MSWAENNWPKVMRLTFMPKVKLQFTASWLLAWCINHDTKLALTKYLMIFRTASWLSVRCSYSIWLTQKSYIVLFNNSHQTRKTCHVECHKKQFWVPFNCFINDLDKEVDGIFKSVDKIGLHS